MCVACTALRTVERSTGPPKMLMLRLASAGSRGEPNLYVIVLELFRYLVRHSIFDLRPSTFDIQVPARPSIRVAAAPKLYFD